MKLIDLTGQVFGRLTVLSFAAVDKRGAAQWLCRCKCGEEKVISGDGLRRGKTQSCKCLSREHAAAQAKQFQALAAEARVKHGHTRGYKCTSEYQSWTGMLTRCTNPNATNYHRYGERGITVCERWRNSFAAFLEDMGPKPEPKRLYSLGRFGDEGNYEPGNVKWMTPKEQTANRRPRQAVSESLVGVAA